MINENVGVFVMCVGNVNIIVVKGGCINSGGGFDLIVMNLVMK